METREWYLNCLDKNLNEKLNMRIDEDISGEK